MDIIKLFNEDESLLDTLSFAIIRPFGQKYLVGYRYSFFNANQTNYLGTRFLKSKLNFELKNFPDCYSWLLANCSASKFKEIQQKIFNAKINQTYSVLIFSSVESELYITNQMEIFNSK